LSAKGNAPSTGSTSATGNSRGLFGGFFAPRGASSGSDGSGAPSRGRRPLALILLALSALMLLALAPAANAAPKNVAAIIGAETDEPGDPGEFQIPAGVAVNQDTGDLYVVDQDRNRIQRFDEDGTYISQWGSPGGEEGQFSFAGNPDIVIDPADGSVYVADTENSRVQKFSADGTFLYTFGSNVDIENPSTEFEICVDDTPAQDCQGSFTEGSGAGEFLRPTGIAIDPSNGDVLVSDIFRSRVLRFDNSGNYLSEFSATTEEGASLNASRIGVDGAGNIYLMVTFEFGATDTGGLWKFDSAGNLIGKFAPSVVSYNVTAFAIDLPTGNVFASEDTNTPTGQIKELDSSGTLLATSSYPSPYGASGLALRSATGYLYASTGDGEFEGGGRENRVYLYTDAGATEPDMVIEAPKDVTASTAVLRGSVNPNGGLPVAVHFEISTDGINWTQVAPDEDIGAGEDPVKVSQTATGLQANTNYRVRLVADKGFGNPEFYSAELTFQTDAIGPTAITAPPQNFSDTTAILVGNINPNGTPTSYYFELGKTTSYGDQIPLPAANAGSAATAKFFRATASGLEPNTTYHYRVVAESDLGVGKGADQTFTTRAPFIGFPSRAYEQVSPVFKNGKDIDDDPGQVSADGNVAIFSYDGALAGQKFGGGAGLSVSQYVVHRTPTGWVTSPIWPRPKNLGSNRFVFETDADLTKAALFVQAGTGEDTGGFEDDPDPNHKSGVYSMELGANSGTIAGLRHVVLPTPHPVFSETFYYGASADLSHFVGTRGFDTYDGGTREIFFQPGTNEPFPPRPGAPPTPTLGFDPVTPIVGSAEGAFGDFAVSDDGEYIFFSNPRYRTEGEASDQVTIYRRDQGTETIVVSPSQRTVPDPQGPKRKLFRSATPDQGPDDPAAVFFVSSEELTDDANTGPSRDGLDLYRYEINSDTLTDISASTNGPNGAEVLDHPLIGHSEDGDWVYYAASSQIVPGKGVAGQPNVYLWHDDGTADGETRFIATLAPGNCTSGGDACNLGEKRSLRVSRVSADGQTLLFQSARSLTGHPTQGQPNAYIYEADANGGSGALSCVSCRPDGAASQAPTRLEVGQPFAGNRPVRTLSDDGSQVFFDTAEKLVPQDINGVRDVYTWHDGRVSLITNGTYSQPVNFHNASADGSSVFFQTREALVGQDTEPDIVDLYVARVGGGIPEQNPPPPGEPCASSDQCKPASQAPTGFIAPPSMTLPSTGNVPPGQGPGKCGKGKVRRNGKCVPKKCPQGKVRKKGKCVKKQSAKQKSAASKRGGK